MGVAQCVMPIFVDKYFSLLILISGIFVLLYKICQEIILQVY